MSRDPTKLKVFEMSDAIVVSVYEATKSFPQEERFGLQSQIRRATISIPANIVEGCSRSTTRDYRHFVTIALGSASEARYLLSLAHRLGFVSTDEHEALAARFNDLVRALQGLVSSLVDL